MYFKQRATVPTQLYEAQDLIMKLIDPKMAQGAFDQMLSLLRDIETEIEARPLIAYGENIEQFSALVKRQL